MAPASLAAAPPAPPGFSAEDLFRGVHWHQGWQVFDGVTTPGRNPVELLCQIVQLPHDLTGKRVLDIGAWNGCFSFECERRGAAEVVSYSMEDPESTGYNRLKKILGSKATYHRGTVYSLTPEEFGTFDVVLFLGVLYHLRYPLLAIDRVRGVARGEVYVETHVIDHAPYLRESLPEGVSPETINKTPLWRQYLASELTPGDPTNWFSPNVVAAVEALESAGFEVETTHVWCERASFRARVIDVPERLMTHAYEALPGNREVVGLASAARKGPRYTT